MNTLERRQIVKGQIIDIAIAKTPISKSRRQGAEAAKKLRKDLAASRFAALRGDVAYPRRALS